MSLSERLEEIRKIIENAKKPPLKQDRGVRSLNDGDIEWLLSRLTRIENTLSILESISLGKLTPRTYIKLLREARQE